MSEMQSRCKFSIFLKSFIFFQGMTIIKKGKICDSPAGAEERFIRFTDLLRPIYEIVIFSREKFDFIQNSDHDRVKRVFFFLVIKYVIKKFLINIFNVS